MRRISGGSFWAVLVTVLSATGAFSGEAVVSTMRNVSAYFQYGGFSIAPVDTTPAAGDYGPAQRFQIVRPSSGGFSIGRLYTSCTCIQVSTDKRSFGHGETAMLTVRNVLPTSGNTYPFYVQITGPIRATLRYDTYVVSDRYAVSAPVVVSHGDAPVVAESEPWTHGEPEIIVPRYEPPADDATPDAAAPADADEATAAFEAAGSGGTDEGEPIENDASTEEVRESGVIGEL